MPFIDRYGLTVSTASPAAFDRFQDGMDRLLAYEPGAEDCFTAALAADENLALAHVGRALLAAVQGDGATARAAA
ncbi:MAG: tetratricopeptide repeat protein, partial [Candidatus Rokuibacteriota bacterium]